MGQVVTHTQRAVMEAIDALTRLEDALTGKVNNPDLEAKLDSIIADLEALVGATGQGAGADSYEEASQALTSESQTRGAGQAARARLCAG
jgi:hypothetical protein